MTARHSIILCLFSSAAALCALGGPSHAQSQEDETDAHGYDKVRIEQEDKLLVPREIRAEVWEFLKSRMVEDREFIRGIDPTFTASWSEELFHDTYYDTPSMQLYAMKSGVRYRRRENLSNPEDVKSGRELMQIKLNDTSENALERAEIKFEIEHPREKRSAMDAHPLFGIVKPSHRGPFEKRLQELGLDARSMKPILTVRDVRRRIYWKKDDKPFMSISFDQADSRIWWASTEFCEIEPELNEIGFTEADEETRATMETVLAKVVSEIRTRFPSIQQDLSPKYNKSFDRLEKQIPFLRPLVRVGLQASHGMYVFFALVALLLFAIYKLIASRMRALRPARANMSPGRAPG
jgi:hypothetical protein